MDKKRRKDHSEKMKAYWASRVIDKRKSRSPRYGKVFNARISQEEYEALDSEAKKRGLSKIAVMMAALEAYYKKTEGEEIDS